VHIQRAFSGIFHGNKKLDKEEVIWEAKELNPDYPGIIDFLLWLLGESRICIENAPKCDECYLNGLCKYSLLK